jgi:hypothetical protein
MQLPRGPVPTLGNRFQAAREDWQEAGIEVRDLLGDVLRMIKGGKTRREEAFRVATSEFNLTKTKGEETEIRIEKYGYYLTKVAIPHVWPAERDYGLQRIHIGWQKDWSGGRWGVDACKAATHWPLKSQRPFEVVMLELAAPAKSPLPEYTESDLRVLEAANK